jgi:hemerythrin-like domain-containing protein
MQAITIIQTEHRSMSAVVRGMLHLVREISARRMEPDFAVFGAMIYYIDAFPERFHHPKEDTYLFARLRVRHPAAGPLLDRLEAEHRAGAEWIRSLEQELIRYQQGGDREFARFEKVVEEYAKFHGQHMHVEEIEILPMAKQHLTPEDWQTIDGAFHGNTDPLLGSDAATRFDDLFRRIVALAPPPLGLGSAR